MLVTFHDRNDPNSVPFANYNEFGFKFRPIESSDINEYLKIPEFGEYGVSVAVDSLMDKWDAKMKFRCLPGDYLRTTFNFVSVHTPVGQGGLCRRVLAEHPDVDAYFDMALTTKSGRRIMATIDELLGMHRDWEHNKDSFVRGRFNEALTNGVEISWGPRTTNGKVGLSARERHLVVVGPIDPQSPYGRELRLVTHLFPEGTTNREVLSDLYNRNYRGELIFAQSTPVDGDGMVTLTVLSKNRNSTHVVDLAKARDPGEWALIVAGLVEENPDCVLTC